MSGNLAEKGERTAAQLREHYEIEKELASKLSGAPKEERTQLYSTLYNELFERVPSHPQLTRKANPIEQQEAARDQMKLLSRFLNPEAIFLEVGPGGCHLSFEVAKHVSKVYAIDVSDNITRNTAQPANFTLILSNGSSVSVPEGSVDVAYSYQLMEHLHPDDAFDQIKNIHTALVKGGVYICITPHQFMGPHDISRYFDDTATGFHLQEYTNTSLNALFKRAGFSKIQAGLSVKAGHALFPIYPAMALEYVLNLFPSRTRKVLSSAMFVRHLLEIRLIVTK